MPPPKVVAARPELIEAPDAPESIQNRLDADTIEDDLLTRLK